MKQRATAAPEALSLPGQLSPRRVAGLGLEDKGPSEWGMRQDNWDLKSWYPRSEGTLTDLGLFRNDPYLTHGETEARLT